MVVPRQQGQYSICWVVVILAYFLPQMGIMPAVGGPLRLSLAAPRRGHRSEVCHLQFLGRGWDF